MQRSRSSGWHEGWSGDVGIDPLTVANLRALYDFGSEAYANNDPLGIAGTSPVHDRSGNGLDLTNTDGVGFRPIFKTGIANGRAVARSVGASLQSLTRGVAMFTAEGEMFLVCRPLNDPNDVSSGPVEVKSSGGFEFPNTSGMITDSFGDGAVGNIVNPAFSLSAAFSIYNSVAALTANGGKDFYLNGPLVAHVASLAAFAWGATIRLCANNNGWWSGDIAEAAFFTRKLTAPERTGITKWYGLKYGITVT